MTFDGTTTVLGMVPSGNTYVAVRDLFLTTGTVNSGVSLNMSGFRLHCQTSLTNNGRIHDNGGNGVTAVSNTQPAGGLAAGIGYYGQTAAVGRPGSNGTPGVAGAPNTGISWPGYAIGNAASSLTTGVTGGAGQGGGGAGAAGAAGSAGGVTAATSTAAQGSPHDLNQRMRGKPENGSPSGGTIANWAGGSGGGTGSVTAASSWSGGSGAGGGIIGVFAKLYTGSGTIEAKGGASGASFWTSPNAGVSNGSGGGGGGVAVVVVGPGSSTPTISVAGGAGGTPANGGSTGGAGGAGLSYLDML